MAAANIEKSEICSVIRMRGVVDDEVEEDEEGCDGSSSYDPIQVSDMESVSARGGS